MCRLGNFCKLFDKYRASKANPSCLQKFRDRNRLISIRDRWRDASRRAIKRLCGLSSKRVRSFGGRSARGSVRAIIVKNGTLAKHLKKRVDWMCRIMEQALEMEGAG